MSKNLKIITKVGIIFIDVSRIDFITDDDNGRLKGLSVFNHVWPAKPEVRLFANPKRINRVANDIMNMAHGDEVTLDSSEWEQFQHKDAELGGIEDFYDLVSYPELASNNEKNSGKNTDTWIVAARWENDKSISLERVKGTELQIRKYLSGLIQKDKKRSTTKWLYGTEFLHEFGTSKDDNGKVMSLCGYGCYTQDYINYKAVRENALTVNELKD